MIKNFLKTPLLVFGGILLLGSACNKDAELIDPDHKEENLDLVTIDTIKLKSNTILDNAINGKDISTVLLGSLSDSRTGSSKASFYSQTSLSVNAFDIGTNPVLDSVVLLLDKTSSYGNLNTNYTVSVFELTSTLEEDAEYDNNTVLNVNGTPLGVLNNHQFKETNEQISIPLSTSFGNSLLDQFETTVMETSENFQEFFKGLYVTTSISTGDAMVSLALKSDDSKMVLYYHTDTENDLSFDYLITNSDITVNQYINNISGSLAENAINDSNEDEEISFVSSMSGIKTTLEFPDLSYLNKVIINKAELSVYQEDYGSNESINLVEPNKLFLFINNGDTSISFLPDFSLSDPDPFGGTKSLVEVNGQNTNEYKFNITRYIQNLVNGSSNHQLYLSDINNNEGNRIQIGGGNNSSLPIKLNIVYTKIK